MNTKTKEIVIEIDENGNCSVDGKGFVGPECGKFVGEIEQSIGSKTKETNKPEFKIRKKTKSKQRQTGRN